MITNNLSITRKLIDLARDLYGIKDFITLYEPTLKGNEKIYYGCEFLCLKALFTVWFFLSAGKAQINPNNSEADSQ